MKIKKRNPIKKKKSITNLNNKKNLITDLSEVAIVVAEVVEEECGNI